MFFAFESGRDLSNGSDRGTISGQLDLLKPCQVKSAGQAFAGRPHAGPSLWISQQKEIKRLKDEDLEKPIPKSHVSLGLGSINARTYCCNSEARMGHFTLHLRLDVLGRRTGKTPRVFVFLKHLIHLLGDERKKEEDEEEEEGEGKVLHNSGCLIVNRSL
ncbi:hypothetical protein AVEN_239089-1 [Araneus ventricosus]|uniref:Uncharacterized protein n=1 Tax=Araneus ventricosus TaxID=182803 RepID=A0A4Y2FRG0_ARAVE|nr:hypothetical protein AVEN_239089-1 [Araneus ventricosus]